MTLQKHILMKKQIISLENLKSVGPELAFRGGQECKLLRFEYHNQQNLDILIAMDDNDDYVEQFNRVCEALGL